MDEIRSGEISPLEVDGSPPPKIDPVDKAAAKPDYRTELTNKIIEHLEKGTAPWQKPWDGRASQLPINAATGKPYQGCNSLWLTMQGYLLHIGLFLLLIVPIALFWTFIGSILASNKVRWLNQSNLQKTASLVLISFSIPLSYSAILSL